MYILGVRCRFWGGGLYSLCLKERGYIPGGGGYFGGLHIDV